MWLIRLDRRKDERENVDEISYCRSIDRSFGSIETERERERTQCFFSFFFSMCLYGSNTDRENDWMSDFFSLLFLLLIHCVKTGQRTHITHNAKERRRRTCSSSSSFFYYLYHWLLVIFNKTIDVSSQSSNGWRRWSITTYIYYCDVV